MNIFVTSECPEESAKYLDDKRCVKMVLESAQILSTVLEQRMVKAPYRSTHRQHPCVQWAMYSRENYQWLLHHFEALCKEYTARYNKIHKSQAHLDLFIDGADWLPSKGRTPFVNCTRNLQLKVDYRNIKPVTVAYQLYLNVRWDNDKREPTWYGSSNNLGN